MDGALRSTSRSTKAKYLRDAPTMSELMARLMSFLSSGDAQGRRTVDVHTSLAAF